MRREILFAFTMLAACADDFDLAADERDSHQNPTEHGEIWFGEPAFGELGTQGQFHSWTFDLHGRADLVARTHRQKPGDKKVDTVLYLYKQKPDGKWGSYIGKNDDADGGVFSRINKKGLTAGHYRAIVKGANATVKGRYALTVDCSGEGCVAPVPPVNTSACLFGETYNDSKQPREDLLVVNSEKLYATSTISDLVAAQVVLAVQQSSHTDVTTAAEAFDRVDEGEINRVVFFEPAAARYFVAYEYGAGDNSYGGFFERDTTTLVASIHDGDLYGCSVLPETCLLGAEYRDLLANPAFSAVSSRVVTAASQLVGVEADQALAAVKRVHPEVQTLAQAIAAADDGQLNLTGVFHAGTRTELLAVEFGAGDTSVGSVFYAGSLVVAGVIEDGYFASCSFFAARGGLQEGQDCRADDACGEGLTCAGRFAGVGKCVSTEPPPVAKECDSDAACGSADLICAGVTRGFGLCAPAWMRGSFGETPDVAIPDGGALVRRLTAYGLATVDTDVELRARFRHASPGQLRVTLTNPAGNEVEVFAGTSENDGDEYLTVEGPITHGFSGDESVNGEWILKVEDRVGGAVGKLIGWDLTVTSRMD